MNICILKARLIKEPKLISKSKNFIINLFISIHNKKSTISSNIACKVEGSIAKYIFSHYKKGDFIIIKGFIQINKENRLNKKKQLNIEIKNIHSASTIFI